MEPRRPRPLLERILARKVEEKKAASSQKIRPENFQGESQTKEPLTKKAQPIKSTPTLLGSSPAKRNRPKHEGEQQEPPAKKARVNNVLHADLPPSPPKPGPKDVDSQDVQAPARTKLPINASPINGPPPRRFLLKRVRPEDTTRAGTLQRHNKLPTGKSKTPTESLPSPKTVPLPATTSLLRHAPLSANNAASLGPVHAASHMKELKEPLPKKDPEEAIRASLRRKMNPMLNPKYHPVELLTIHIIYRSPFHTSKVPLQPRRSTNRPNLLVARKETSRVYQERDRLSQQDRKATRIHLCTPIRLHHKVGTAGSQRHTIRQDYHSRQTCVRHRSPCGPAQDRQVFVACTRAGCW